VGRRSTFALALLVGAVPFIGTAPAGALTTGPDFAVVAVTTNTLQATPGQRLTVAVVAVNRGPGDGDQAVTIATRGLTAERATCAFGISPDGPNDCQYGTPPIGERFTTRFIVQAAAASERVRVATLQACTANLTNERDPLSGNNCRSIRIRLLRSP